MEARGTEFYGARVTGGCELPDVSVLATKLGPLEEQLVLSHLSRPQTGRFKNSLKWKTSLGRGSASVAGVNHLTSPAGSKELEPWKAGAVGSLVQSLDFQRLDEEETLP